MHTLKQSLECIFFQGKRAKNPISEDRNIFCHRVLNNKLLSSCYITMGKSHLGLFGSFDKKLLWLQRQRYIYIYTLQRTSLLPRKTLPIFLTPDKEKHNLYSFLCIKCLQVQIWECCCVLLHAGGFGFYPVSSKQPVWLMYSHVLQLVQSTPTLHLQRIWHSAFFSFKSILTTREPCHLDSQGHDFWTRFTAGKSQRDIWVSLRPVTSKESFKKG